MSRRSNNSATKKANWKYNLIWTVITIVVIGVLFAAIQRKQNATITKVKIALLGIEGNRDLMSVKGVKQMFRNYLGYDLEMAAIRDLDLRDLEELLEADERVKNAEVFVDKNDVLYFQIYQREPIVRVINRDKTSFYLDKEGNSIPAIKGSTIRVPLASGNIENYDKKLLENAKQSKLKDVFTMAKYINEDDFLRALIEQIDIDQEGEITLIPKLGRMKLEFGKAEDLDDRFEKLKIMYKDGLPKLGWRKYDKLVLKYEGQVNGSINK